MYTIIHVVWGYPLTEAAFQRHNEEMEKDEDLPEILATDGGWFANTYSGNGFYPVAWVGKCVAEYSAIEPLDYQDIERKKQMLTEEDQECIRKEYEELPDHIKEFICKEPKWCLMFGTS